MKISCWLSQSVLILAACGSPTGSVGAKVDGSTDVSTDGPRPCGTGKAVQVSTGAQYSCARLSDGTLRCWGANYQAQLGDGVMQHQACDDPSGEPFDCSPRPVEVAGISDATWVASDFDTACALRADGHVACWGINTEGQAGVEPPTREYNPVTVPTVSDATALAVGLEHACALTSDGHVSCWGTNELGQLGEGQVDHDPHPSPVAVVEMTRATAIAAGGNTSCALLSDASVSCWGEGDLGEIGDGSMTSAVDTPTKVMGLDNVSAVALGERHGCALRTDGTVWCWGANDGGQVGSGTGTNALTPVEVPTLSNVVAIAAGGAHTCARESDGSLWCWGYFGQNQLPVSSLDMNYGPLPVTHVGALDGVISIGPSLQHDCFVEPDGGVRCGGRDDTGELGDGSVAPYGALTTVCW